MSFTVFLMYDKMGYFGFGWPNSELVNLIHDSESYNNISNKAGSIPYDRTLYLWNVRNYFYYTSIHIGLVSEATENQRLSGKRNNNSSQKVKFLSAS